MSGRRLVTAFLAFLVVFVAALIWFQFFAYYRRESAAPALAALPAVTGYTGIDATSSPLKIRGCFTLDPAAAAALAPAPKPTPLTAPFWFRCFNARTLTEDLASGAARAYEVAPDKPEGFDTVLAVYPDGRGYLWRQLNGKYTD